MALVCEAALLGRGPSSKGHKEMAIVDYQARIQEAMIMKNKLPRFRDVLTFSVLLFRVSPAVSPVQEADRLRHSPPALQVLV
jgi:hypothetical protein